MRRPNRCRGTSALIVLALLAASCGRQPGEPSTAERALAELHQQFEELKRRAGDDPVDWAKEDLENIGDWEYRVAELPETGTEELAAALNRLGDERWEAFWVDSSPNGLRIMLKRPAVSYIGRAPFSVIGHAVGEGAEGR
jgi:hypothetical protein